ncbi:MAG: hypothetical protein U9Q81_05200, partial [Pseudomonadota bacterium]|nr:hypothetical protein [Pseudomonadota bacterium]
RQLIAIGHGREQTADYGELLLRILTYPLSPLIYLPLLIEKLQFQVYQRLLASGGNWGRLGAAVRASSRLHKKGAPQG